MDKKQQDSSQRNAPRPAPILKADVSDVQKQDSGR
jgi:hypothetical protein